MFFEGNNRIYIGGAAQILGDYGLAGVEVATSEWASKYIVPNEANAHILGRFVEADRANNNKQFFRMGDLLMAQPTISNAPMNLNHQTSPIGAYIASEFQYPKGEDENPYIEALSIFWKHYFPDQWAIVQQAWAEGSLFYSMEAVPKSLSTIGGSDDEAEYAYEGRQSPNYPEEINERSCDAIVLNSPHFVGGALIVPPAKPGWSNADIKAVSKFVHEQWETAEAVYEAVKAETPHLDPATWERMMTDLLLLATEHAEMKKKKGSSSKSC